jgi:hypothetical protein
MLCLKLEVLSAFNMSHVIVYTVQLASRASECGNCRTKNRHAANSVIKGLYWEADSYLRYLRNCPHFTETWWFITMITTASLLSLFLAKLLYFTPFHVFFVVRFNIILLSTSSCCKWLFFFRVSHTNPVVHLFYMPCPSHQHELCH